MIKQLQKRFIRIAVVTLAAAVVLVVGIVNIANWLSVRKELSDTLNLLTESYEAPETLETPENWTPPKLPEGNPEEAADKAEDGTDTTDENGGQRKIRIFPSRHFRNMVSESNWFSAIISAEGETVRLRMDRIENLEEDAARELVRKASAEGRTEGFLQDYLYRIRDLSGGRRKIVMLSCETRLTTLRTLVLISVCACIGAVLLAWLLVTLASRKAVEPIIRNMEQQKRFITDASHELKTPLTVIATNMELLQMETEDNPWVKSTQKQTDIMRRLVDELVYLSRMEEEHPKLEMEPMDAGKLLEEAAEPFIAVAEFNGREMTVTAEKGLRMTGDKASIQRLMTTLCDNAVKYASDGPIKAEIRSEEKNQILLKVSNPVAEPLTKQQCEQLFDRFYRVDPSRNKGKTSGFGIGLAIASAIAEKHGGRISAAMEGNRLAFSCLLPKGQKK